MSAITLLQPTDTGAESLVIINGNFSELAAEIADAGTVTSVSVVSANGLAGTVANATTNPAITLSTTVTGVLKGNGTSISAAVNSDLPAMTATVGGAVPTPPNNTTTFLRGDGTFATPASSGGTVTSVASADSSITVTNPTTTVDLAVAKSPKLTTARTIAITGDLAYTSPSFDGTGNVTAAGTLATVNSNVGTFGSATKASVVTVNGKGLVTAASESTVTPAVGSITGLGTGVATFLATPSSANLASAVTDETGSGALVFGTNPTIAKPVMSATNPTAQTYSPAGAGTATLDLSLSNQHYITMPAGNITIALSNDTNNQVFLVSITQDSGGSRTVTWFTTIRWAGGSPPTLTTTANKRDTFGFIRTGSGTYDGFIIGQNI